MEQFHGEEVVVTAKRDGENTSMYTDHYHARSLDSRHHVSRDAVKQIWGNIRYQIPVGWRVCGENLYATHSIHYDDLTSYFEGFSVWDERNVKLPYDRCLQLFDDWGVTPVPELWRGIYNEDAIKALWNESMREKMEGYVIQVVREIPYADFGKYVAKFVRSRHVQTDEHWMTKEVVPNKLR